jgi:hypothetical protein
MKNYHYTYVLTTRRESTYAEWSKPNLHFVELRLKQRTKLLKYGTKVATAVAN